MYQVAVHGGYNPEYYHFSDAQKLVEWMVDECAGRILEVTVNEV